MAKIFQHPASELNSEFDNIYQQVAASGGGAGAIITTATAAPSDAPDTIGELYIDTTTKNVYISSDTAGAYSWAFVGKGASTAFDKDTVAGLTSWYKAEDASPTTEGTNITSWLDSSDSGNTLTTASGTRAYTSSVQNGQPAIRFSAGFIHGSDLSDRPQPITTFVVFKPTNWGTGGYQGVYGMAPVNSPPYCALYKNTGNANLYVDAGAGLIGSAVANNTPNIVTSVFNSTTSSVQVNDSSPTLGNAGTNVNPSWPIIGYSSTHYYTGYVMELLVYDGALTSTDQDIVRAYLNNKYAIY